MMTTTPISLRRLRWFALALLMCVSLLTACGNQESGSSNITLTLAGPNQWNDSGTSFGPGWDKAVKDFQNLNPGVTVKITVLPLSSFYQTISTQLAAGTAADLVFNQAQYKPYMVTKLDDYLKQPNPYAPERKQWLDWFNPNAFGYKTSVAADGHLYWVPFNLVDAGLFVNRDAFTKAGVDFPLKTWKDWVNAVPKLKAAGYTPLAMDNSNLGTSWTSSTVFSMMLQKYFDEWNVYDSAGKEGKAESLTMKSWVRAVKLGKMNSKLPEVAKSLEIIKEAFDAATPNWSGIKGLSGAGVGLPDFVAGRAAMAWGVNFGATEVAKATFKVGSMPFPTITTDTTPLSANFPAEFGVAAGGTSYMIPSTVKGDHLKYAVKFLQFMTAPKYSQPWITTTTGVPSVDTVTAPDSISGFSEGDWGKTPPLNGLTLTGLSPQQGQDYSQILQGYLLGTSSLADTQNKLDAAWKQAADYQIQQNPTWKDESWAK